MKNLNRKEFLILTATTLLAVTLPGCGGAAGTGDSSDADEVRASLDGLLSELKAAKGEAYDAAIAKMEELCGDKLDEMGITADELAREYLQEFDYEIEDVQITGSSAQAKVKLSARSVTQVIKDTAAKGDPLHFKRDDLLATLREAPAQDTEATVYVSKAADGSWDAKDGLTLALVKLCF